jgi:hypothetical protein
METTNALKRLDVIALVLIVSMALVPLAAFLAH